RSTKDRKNFLTCPIRNRTPRNLDKIRCRSSVKIPREILCVLLAHYAPPLGNTFRSFDISTATPFGAALKPSFGDRRKELMAFSATVQVPRKSESLTQAVDLQLIFFSRR